MATLYVHIPGSGIISHGVPQNQPLTIGEAAENAFPLKAPSVSPRHAEIIFENGTYKLRDLGSANKCWVNGVAIFEAGLKEGDSVRFGKIEGLFLESDPGEGKSAVEARLRGRLALATPEGDTDIVQFEGAATVGWKSDNDVRIKDPSVSGHHAQFIQQGGKFVLRDLGSTNKTFVNQEPIAEQEVQDGDIVQFGAVRGTLTIHYGLQRQAGSGVSDVAAKGLADEVEKLKKETETLAKERDGLEFHNKALAAQLKDAEEQLDKLQSETDSNRKVIDLKEKSIATALSIAGARVTALEESLKAAGEKTAKAERELQNAKGQVEALSGDQTGQQQKIASLMQARDTLRAEKEQFSTQLAAAQAQVEAETKAAAESTRKQKEAAARLLEQENAIGELKSEIDGLKAKLDAALAKRDETLLRLENASRDRDRDQSQATEEVAAAEARAAKAEKEAKEAREAVELTARKLRDSNALISTLSGDQTGDRQQIAALTQTRDSFQQEKDRLATQLTEAKAETEKAARERDELRKSLDETASRIKILTADCDGFKSYEKSLQQRIEELMRERDLAKASATDLQAQIDLLCTENDEVRAEVKETQVKLDAMAKERDAAKAAEAGLQCKLDAMTEERDEAKAASVTLQAKVDSVSKERDEARATVTETEAKLTAMTQERNAAKISNAELESKFAAATRDGASSQSTASDLQGRLAALTKERDLLKTSLSEAQAKAGADARDLEAAKASSGELRGQLESLVRDRRSAQGAESGLQAQLDGLARERDALKAEVAAAAGKLSLAQSEIAALAARPAAPAPVPVAMPAAVAPAAAAPAPMPTLSMPTVSMPSVQMPSTPRHPVPVATPAPVQPAASSFPPVPKLSLAQEEPLSPPPVAADPRHSLIEIAPPAHDPGMVSTRPVPVFGGGAPDLKKILETAPEALNSMRRSLHAFIKNQMEMSLLEEFQVGLHCMAEETRRANVTPVATLSNALEMLVDDLKKIPGQINPSSLRTVSQAVDFLVTLIHEKNLSLTQDPAQARLFAIDDDPDARKTILAALETLGLNVSSAVDAKGALAAFDKDQYDLVLIDVGLPDINGFELCTRLRKLPNYKKVPVVFITGAVTVQNRVQSSLSGGNDFIAKPFNLLELGVKALIWIFKGQIGLL
ncbi:MAG: FHA domain-containing protein [Chthoniobacteraceae bacterium]